MAYPPYTLDVRFKECDMYGHVNHAEYLSYLEAARVDLLKIAGSPLDQLTAGGIRLFIVKIEIEYLSSAELYDRLEIHTEVKASGRVSAVFRQKIFRGETLVVRADVHWACVNNQGRPTKIPENLKKIFNL